MKKFVLGTALGVTLGILGYKTYKDHEEEVNEFLDEYLNKDDDFDEDDEYDYGDYYDEYLDEEDDLYDEDFDLSNVDVETLESLKEEIEEVLKSKKVEEKEEEIVLNVSPKKEEVEE